jgi:hypothetical protein
MLSGQRFVILAMFYCMFASNYVNKKQLIKSGFICSCGELLPLAKALFARWSLFGIFAILRPFLVFSSNLDKRRSRQ